MKIVLFKDGKEQTFTPDFIPGRVLREAISFQAKQSKKDSIDEEDVDDMINIIVKAYGKQFSIDDVYDGVDARNFMNVIKEQLTEIISGGKGNDQGKHPATTQ